VAFSAEESTGRVSRRKVNANKEATLLLKGLEHQDDAPLRRSKMKFIWDRGMKSASMHQSERNLGKATNYRFSNHGSMPNCCFRKGIMLYHHR